MSDTAAIVMGSIFGGLGGCVACTILVVRLTCPNLFARYFGWRTETVSFVPSEVVTPNPTLTIKTPREQTLRVYRSNKELSGSRRLT